MFNPEDFEIPLEAKLKQRVIFDEINECSDVEALRENLKNITALFMRYQHLLNTVIAKQIELNLQNHFALLEASYDEQIQSDL